MPEQRKFSALPIPLPANADYNNQSIPLPGTERPGQTAIYRNSAFALRTLETPGVITNLVDLFDEGLRRSKRGPFLGHRPIVSKNPLTYTSHYVWESWTEVDARRRAVGSALHKLFEAKELAGGQYDTVGLWSKNCPNWLVVDLACQAYNKVTVALYDTLGVDSVEYIINHAELSIVFAAPEHLPFLLTIADKVPTLMMVISLQPLDEEHKRILTTWAKSLNLRLMDMSEFEELGRADLVHPLPATSDTMATICYTSGTSGMPKGVLLTHGSMALAVYSFEHANTVREDGVILSFLPLAHVFQRLMELCTVLEGNRIGYATGDPLRLLEDMQILKPHFVALVPRIMSRIVYQSAMVASSAPGLKGALFRQAVATKLHNLHTTGKMTHPLWDKLVFSKFHQLLGGRVERVACGSAPLSKDIAGFMKIALLADVMEGYGMTENCACSTVHWPNDPSAGGTVGAVHPISEIKLIDVPALGYRVTDKPFPRGELLMRGAARCSGYFKDDQKTRETIDEEGWLHSGDVATLDAQGRFRIIDRVKNIMKLAQGEYVALEHIEHVYAGCPLVAQLFVYGDSFQTFLVAVVVPDPSQLANLVQRVLKENVDSADVRALQRYTDHPSVVAAALAELNSQLSVQKLKGFEKVKRIYLTLDAFTVENGCLTPTFKIRRKETYEKFKSHIDALYALPAASSKM